MAAAIVSLLFQVLLLLECYILVHAIHREEATTAFPPAEKQPSAPLSPTFALSSASSEQLTYKQSVASAVRPASGRFALVDVDEDDEEEEQHNNDAAGVEKAQASSSGVGRVQPELTSSHTSSLSTARSASNAAAATDLHHLHSIMPHSYVNATASSFAELKQVRRETRSGSTSSSNTNAGAVAASSAHSRQTASILSATNATVVNEGEALAGAGTRAALGSSVSTQSLASSVGSSKALAARTSQNSKNLQTLQGSLAEQGASRDSQARLVDASQSIRATAAAKEAATRGVAASSDKLFLAQEATRKSGAATGSEVARARRPCRRFRVQPENDVSSFFESVANSVHHHLSEVGIAEPCRCGDLDRGDDLDESPVVLELGYIIKCIIAGCVAMTTLFCILLWQTRYKGQSIDVISYVPVAGYILPTPMHVVQDLDHLVLMLLWVAGCGTCITMTVNIIRGKGWLCETLGLLTLIPVLRVVSFCVCSYDDRLFTKRQEVQRKKEEIQGLYGEMLEDLEKRLAQASESNAGMVEQSFSSKKQDFVRFLDWLSDLDLPTTGTIAMRAFVVQWLVIFQETSVEPATKPRLGGTPTFMEIMDCTDAEFPSATPILMDELKKENVRFIEAEQDKVQQQKQKQQKRKELDEKRKSCVSPWQKEMMGQENNWFQPDNSDQIGFEGGDIELAMIREHEGPFPFKAFLGCCRVTIFNKSHLTILLGVLSTPILCCCFIIDTILRKEKVGEDAEHVTSQFGLFAVFCCCILVLRDFERIDAVMQLETEIEELEQDRQKLVQQRVGVGAFFGNTQTLVDFWLYRTIPLLDLMHELHERIKDDYPGSPDQILLEIGSAVSSLKEIRHRIDAPEAWLMTISEDALCNTGGGGGGGQSPSKSPGGSFGDDSPTKSGSTYASFANWVKAQKKGGHDLTTLVDGLDHNIEKLEVDFLRYAADSESDDETEGQPRTIMAAARRSVFSPPTVAGEATGTGRKSIHAVTGQPKPPAPGISFDNPNSPQPPKFQGKR